MEKAWFLHTVSHIGLFTFKLKSSTLQGKNVTAQYCKFHSHGHPVIILQDMHSATLFLPMSIHRDAYFIAMCAEQNAIICYLPCLLQYISFTALM